jgi:hypothetical protein
MSEAANVLAGRDWAATFNQVEQSLALALETVRQRQKALDEYFQGAQAAETPPTSWPTALQEAWQRVQHLPALVERAGASVAEVDAALAEGEAALKEWLAATGAARGKLAKWLAGAVG